MAYLRADSYDSYRPYKIWLIDSDGNSERIFRKGIRARSVKWSRDGHSLFYSDGMNVFKISLLGTEDPQLMYTFGFDYDIAHFDLSADEKFILFDNNGPGN